MNMPLCKIFSGARIWSPLTLAAGADILRVMDQARHKEVQRLKAYDRRAKAFKGQAGEAFL